MFIVDDIVFRALGLEMPGLDLLWMIEQLRDISFKGMYDTGKIKSQLKENRMLFEIGDIPVEEYERKNAALLQKLKLAERYDEMDIQIKGDIFGAR